MFEFIELVVGAPHSKDNKGAVFIYSGTNTGLSDNPQVDYLFVYFNF